MIKELLSMFDLRVKEGSICIVEYDSYWAGLYLVDVEMKK